MTIGKTATIEEFENDDIFLKFMEMGCVPGEVISLIQIAPMGDPISISVAGYQLSLRLDEAKMIWVKELPLTETSKNNGPFQGESY